MTEATTETNNPPASNCTPASAPMTPSEKFIAKLDQAVSDMNDAIAATEQRRDGFARLRDACRDNPSLIDVVAPAIGAVNPYFLQDTTA